METFFRFLRINLILLLMGLVAWQSYFSAEKFLQYDTVNVLATEYPEKQTFPTLSFCAFMVDDNFDFISNDLYLNWTFYDELNDIKKLPEYILSFEHNQLDEIPLDLETDDEFVRKHVKAWTSHAYSMPFYHPNLTKCYTYTPVMNYSGGFGSHFGVRINSSTINTLFVHLHSAAHGLLMSNPIFGLQTIKINVEDKYEEYKISTTKNIVRSQNHLPCYENGNKHPEENLQTCVENWFQKNYSCILPWNNNGTTGFECDCGDHFIYLREYKDLYFYFLDSTPYGLYLKTGCYFDCTYLEFVPMLHSRKPYDGNLLLGFFLAPTGVLVSKEVLAYDFYDLVGNIGGFLGLFLGASFLSMYDGLREIAFPRVKNKKR